MKNAVSLLLLFLGSSLCSYAQKGPNSSPKGAQFEGGLYELFDYVQSEVNYPLEAMNSGIEGRVFVQFTIERNGELTELKVVEGLGEPFDEEALRVMRSMPKWKPGSSNGTDIRQTVIHSILFRPPSSPYLAAKKPKKKREYKGRIYAEVDQNAQYEGGASAFTAYLKKELNYPKEQIKSGTQGRVYVQFVVEKDGTITNAVVIRGLGDAFDVEALRLILDMPAWKPAVNKKKAVRQKMVRSIYFNPASS